jgi:two-component system response regulator YesN
MRREQGTTFGRYLTGLRLARAKHMLSTTGLPVARVAEQAGFRSRPYFQQAFRVHTDETPMAYRRRTRR